jgi:hypothetical protein
MSSDPATPPVKCAIMVIVGCMCNGPITIGGRTYGGPNGKSRLNERAELPVTSSNASALPSTCKPICR